MRHHPANAYEFGLSILKEQIESRSFIPGYLIDVLNRNFDYHPDGTIANPRATPSKLTSALLAQYDQVWFFGQHLAAFKSDHTTIDGDDEGGPQSELDDNEVAALDTWMRTRQGGVLITGDHSNSVANSGDLIDSTLNGQTLNLGRALGYRIPRAKQMRVWVGDPSAYTGVVDTSGDTEMLVMTRQEDGTPQDMRTRTYELKRDLHSIGLMRHPLFLRYTEDPLTNFIGVGVFPDHGHEGALTTPADFTSTALGPFPQSDWPLSSYGGQPIPETVAIGINQLNGQPVGLIAAYDGHQAGIGRIVADSTWHHYVNVNLYGFREQAPEVLEEITDYYVNLVSYLTPEITRTAQLRALINYALAVPSVREVRSASISVLGRQAITALRGITTPLMLGDLALSLINIDTKGSHHRHTSTLPATELWLGATLQILLRQRCDNESEHDDFRRILAQGLRVATSDMLGELHARQEVFSSLLEELEAVPLP